MTKRRKLRNVRYRQWRRWLQYRDRLPVRWLFGGVSLPLAWSSERWWPRRHRW
jgi:hypothetical protein